MQATINMAKALLERGRELWEQDHYEAATRVLSRLLGLRVIPAKIAERAQFYLGDMHLAQGHYAKARRHLSAAIGSGTGSGDTHFMMACALDWDDEPDPRLAYDHYRQAVALEPGQPLYSSAYALMRIRRKSGRTKFDREALRRLRDAFAAEPDDADIVYNYISGLIEMGRNGEAEIALRRARKRWVGHPAFEQLWYDFLDRSGELPRAAAKPATTLRLCAADDEEPAILPFPGVRPAEPTSRPLRPQSRLGTVLQSLCDDDIAELAKRLGLPQCDAAEQRRRIRLALLDGRTLRALIARLSAGGHRLIRVLTQAGGSEQFQRLRLRVDAASSPRPHFTASRSARPLDELERLGIVFRTNPTPDQPDAERVMIPSDLRRKVREIVASAD